MKKLIKVNGGEVELEGNYTISKYLELNGYKKWLVAVECNGEIVSKDNYDSKIIKDGDVLEIVTFVGGG